MHRETRNKQQRYKFLDPGFQNVTVDPIPYKLMHPSEYPEFADQRHNLVFWARPTEAIIQLVREVQTRLKEVAPGQYPGYRALWDLTD